MSQGAAGVLPKELGSAQGDSPEAWNSSDRQGGGSEVVFPQRKLHGFGLRDAKLF